MPARSLNFCNSIFCCAFVNKMDVGRVSPSAVLYLEFVVLACFSYIYVSRWKDPLDFLYKVALSV